MVVARLLQLKLYLAVNTIWRGSLLRKIGTGVGALVMVAGLFYFYTASFFVWRLLRQSIGPETVYVLPLIFTAIFLFLLTGGVVAGLRQLYIATDLELLLSLPVPLRDIFLVKSFEVALAEGGMLVLAGVPLAAYGAAAGLGPAYYGFLLVALVALGLLSTWFDLILVVGLVRVLPPNRARQLMVGVSAGLGMAVYLGSRLLSPGGTGRPVPRSARGLTDLALQVVALGHTVAWLPPGWGGGLLIGDALGDLGLLALNAALLFGLTAALGVGGYALFARAFYQGWSATQGVSRRPAPARPEAAAAEVRPARRRTLGWLLPPLALLARPLPPPVRALVIKDWRTALRDPNYLTQGAWVLLFLGVSLFTTLRPSGRLPDPGNRFWTALASLPLAPYLLCQLLAVPAFGREGAAFAILRGSSLATRTIFLAKWLAAAVPVTLFTWVLITGLAVLEGATPLQTGLALVAAGVLCAGLALIGVAAGAIAPERRVRRERTAQAGGFLGTVTWFILSVFYTGATLAVALLFLGAPAGLTFRLPPALDPYAWVLPVGALLIYGLVLSGVAFLVFFALRRLEAWQDL